MTNEKNLSSSAQEFETAEEFANSNDYQELPYQEQRTARLVLIHGDSRDQKQIFAKITRRPFLGFAYTGIHEAGHQIAAWLIDAGNVTAQVFKNGGGVTRFIPKWKGSAALFFKELMFTSFAGRKAVEAFGFKSRGDSSDMKQVDSLASEYSRLTGLSGSNLKSDAENWAEDCMSANKNRLISIGLDDAQLAA